MVRMKELLELGSVRDDQTIFIYVVQVRLYKYVPTLSFLDFRASTYLSFVCF
jgi:hypothetical protein